MAQKRNTETLESQQEETPIEPEALADLSADKKTVISFFKQTHKANRELGVAFSALTTIFEVIRRTENNTVMGLLQEISNASRLLEAECTNSIGVHAGCRLFSAFIERLSASQRGGCDFETLKRGILTSRGSLLGVIPLCRTKICIAAGEFVRDGTTVLIHGADPTILDTLRTAKRNHVNFNVIVNEALPLRNGRETALMLEKIGVSTTLTLDSNIASAVEKADFCFVGSEGLVESGGFVGQIGTRSVAIIAKSLKRPFYVVAESFKFTRKNSLVYQDFLKHQKPVEYIESAPLNSEKKRLKILKPLFEFTEPQFVSLYLTDLGVLTPSAVGEALLKT